MQQQYEEQAQMTEKHIRHVAIDILIDIDIDVFISKHFPSQKCVKSFSSQTCAKRIRLDKASERKSHKTKPTFQLFQKLERERWYPRDSRFLGFS